MKKQGGAFWSEATVTILAKKEARGVATPRVLGALKGRVFLVRSASSAEAVLDALLPVVLKKTLWISVAAAGPVPDAFG
jgi:hypothetical protein